MKLTPTAQIRGIIFDFDGTLVDSLTVTFEAFNAGLASQGTQALTPSELMSYFGAGERAIFAKLVGAENSEAAYQISLAYTQSKQRALPLHSGIAELLEELHSRRIPMAIFTGRGRETTELILAHHQLTPFFQGIITHDDVGQPKPHPEGLLLAADIVKISPNECLMVGDSWADVRSAHSAGAYSAAALWDQYVEKARIEAEKPQWALRNPSQILEILKKQ